MRKYRLFVSIALSVIVLDQLSKFFVVSRIGLNDGFAWIQGWFNIVHVRNPGAAFGFLSESGFLVSYLFIFISVTALLAILVLLYKSQTEKLLFISGLGFFFGGTSGNLIDRLLHGEVIDFLDFHIGNYHWPAFNVADSALCLAASLIILSMYKEA
jgi:signal peptidase II